MQSTITIKLTVSVIGDDAGDAANVIASTIGDGWLDLALLDVLRAEFPNDAALPALAGDWRIASVSTAVAGEVAA